MDRDRFLGGNPLGVIVRLIVVSIIVGIVLSALNIDPWNIPYHIRLLAQRLYEMGFGIFKDAFGYFLLGAIVVIPIWLLTRALGLFRAGRDQDRPR
jgi:Family of unknown function (DUF6460)